MAEYKPKGILKKTNYPSYEDEENGNRPDPNSSATGQQPYSTHLAPESNEPEGNPSDEDDEDEFEGPLEGENAQFRKRRKTPFPGSKKRDVVGKTVRTPKEPNNVKEETKTLKSGSESRNSRKELRFCCIPFKR